MSPIVPMVVVTALQSQDLYHGYARNAHYLFFLMWLGKCPYLAVFYITSFRVIV